MLKLRVGVAVVACLSLMFGAVGAVSASNNERHLNMLDDCDSVTFNLVVGPGTCVKDGDTTFSAFVGQLIAMGRAPAWRFAPSTMKLPAGGSIDAYNKGGEAHSFTEVAHFGGGCIQVLNDLLGLTPVPECGNPALFPGTVAGPGGEIETAPLSPGVHLFECLIHPWMRTTVTVH